MGSVFSKTFQASAKRSTVISHQPIFRCYSCIGHMKLLTLLLTGLLPGQSLLITNPSISNAPILTMKLGRGMWLRRRPSVFGLIGGIASGKSTVSRTLEAEFGIAVIDADKLGHDSYQPGTRCFNNLVHVFGQGIVSDDGTINRRALGEAVSNVLRLCHLRTLCVTLNLPKAPLLTYDNRRQYRGTCNVGAPLPDLLRKLTHVTWSDNQVG